MVNGKQCTILWHVDDLKISYLDPEVVKDIIKLLNNWYGKEAPLVAGHKGKGAQLPWHDFRFQ
jgi:hypothetical protein